MSDKGLLRKDQLEISLHQEKKLIEDGILKEDNPLDVSDNFRRLCEAARRGDMKVCQEMIQEGVNINAKDQYDYTPLILASLCGHFETVQLLLESGALCERDTFQGERCLYNALNDRIRNLLLSYDYSKSTDPLQPLAAHLVTLLTKDQPRTSDIAVLSSEDAFHLHKFILSARSSYFRGKLSAAPETTTWKLPGKIPPQAFSIVLSHIYLGELPLPSNLGGGPGTGFTDSEILGGIDQICKHLEIPALSNLILDGTDRRLARQRRQDEVATGRDQLESWFLSNTLKHSVTTTTSRAADVSWDRINGVFADILLRADEDDEDDGDEIENEIGRSANSNGNHNILGIPLGTSRSPSRTRTSSTNALGIPLGPSRSPSRNRKPKKAVLYPCHKAMLIRSEFFMTMFDSEFREAQDTPYLQIVQLDCSPAVLEIILTFLYTERAEFGLEIAIDVLFAADMLFLEKLKAKAAVVISSLGNGTATAMPTELVREDDFLDIYEILRAAWITRVQRLEEFAARYIAFRLEQYIDEPEFAVLVQESASRITARQETDSIELLDDIRYYLSEERFRLRFEEVGLDEAMEDEMALANAAQAEQTPIVNGVDAQPAKGASPHSDEGIDMTVPPNGMLHTDTFLQSGAVRTLDGELAGDEFAADAVNYQILLGKIDALLEKLKLDA